MVFVVANTSILLLLLAETPRNTVIATTVTLYCKPGDNPVILTLNSFPMVALTVSPVNWVAVIVKFEKLGIPVFIGDPQDIVVHVGPVLSIVTLTGSDGGPGNT